MTGSRRVLVTGATGYVGGALVPRLLAAGHEVVCLVRDRDRLVAPWRTEVTLVEGRVEDPQAVLRAADGVDVAYYLVHGMDGPQAGLVEREQAAAAAFRDGVDLAGVGSVVYLGGLVDQRALARTSTHLYARQQAGVELRAGRVPVTELRAGIVLGAGSASFELLVAAARSPISPVTGWSQTRTQPLAVADLLEVLVAVPDHARARGQVLDLGGPEVLTYRELVAATRAALGAPPALPVPAPLVAPEVLAVTAARRAGLPPQLTVALLRSATVDAVVRDERASRWFPALRRTTVRAALAAALVTS